MRADLSVVGPAASLQRYLVSGGTSIEAGEPLHSLGTPTAGAQNTNTYVLAAADTPVIGTHRFGGVALSDSKNAVAGTVLEQFLTTTNPVPNVGRVKGRAETAANVDTLTELALLIGDAVLIDYSASGGVGGAQLYTIKDVASANTSGLEIYNGNTSTSVLEVFVDPRAYRNVIS